MRPSLFLVAILLVGWTAGGAEKPDSAKETRSVSSAPLASRWSVDRAWRWYRSAGSIRGFNYVPRTAINDTEIWQGETFDPRTIDQELGWAHEAGYNSLRLFLQYIVWQADSEGLKKCIDEFLTIADRRGLTTVLVLFDDCAFSGKEPYLGKQDDPIPGVFANAWVPSPGLRRVTDRTVWPDLEEYVKDVIGSFNHDRRVLIWDLYNEPGNSNMGEKSLPLVEASFAWARAVHPSQPLTCAPWEDFNSIMSKRLTELSDVTSFHGYDIPDGVIAKISICQASGRPVICTEFLRRQVGNTFAAILPIFAAHHIGWHNWGLVAGKTQTYLHWGSKRGDPVPRIWQHDILHADGTPYDPRELELIKSWRPVLRNRQ
jgi:hypothetical protein